MIWEKVKLASLVQVKTGKYDVNHSVVDGVYPFYTCALEPFKANTYSFEGDLIMLPGNGANVGEVVFYSGRAEAYQRTYVLHEIQTHPKYLYYFLQKEWKKSLGNKQYGSATNYIRLDNITELKVPLPSLSTQQKIAAILDKADALRKKDQQLITKYDELLKSIFYAMFGDPMKNEKGWEIRKIEEIAKPRKHSIKAGPFGSSLKKEFYVEKGYKIYGQEQVIRDDLSYGDYYIDEAKYKELISCKIEAGDILISLVGTYGKISIVPDEFEKGIINPRLMKISPDESKISSLFFKELLLNKSIRRQIESYSRGGTMDIVNLGIIKDILIPVPPIELQNHFEMIVKNIHNQRLQVKQQLQYSTNLFQVLLQKAFKGELIQ